MRFAIIGAGLAGLACADALTGGGHTVALFDKGRGAGGRMAVRRVATPLGEVTFDFGAQYFTARHPGFCRLVDSWRDLGIVEPWPLVAEDAWVGRPAMNAVIRHMAEQHDVSWAHRVTGLLRRDRQWWLAGEGGRGEIGPFDGAILAIPAEQAASFLSLHDFAMARIALTARSRPCWTGMFVFHSALPGLPGIIRTGGDIAWAARNGAKPGRAGPEAWVVQANASWSEARIDAAAQDIAAQLRAALSDAAGRTIPEPVTAMTHRWRYALSAGTGDGALWQPALGLGACGDWLLGPRVECAWLSGSMLGARIVARRLVTNG